MTIKKIKVWDLHIGDYFYLYEHCAEHCKRQVFERTFNKLWGQIVKTNCETLLPGKEVFIKLQEVPLVEVWKEKTMIKIQFSKVAAGEKYKLTAGGNCYLKDVDGNAWSRVVNPLDYDKVLVDRPAIINQLPCGTKIRYGGQICMTIDQYSGTHRMVTIIEEGPKKGFVNNIKYGTEVEVVE